MCLLGCSDLVISMVRGMWFAKLVIMSIDLLLKLVDTRHGSFRDPWHSLK